MENNNQNDKFYEEEVLRRVFTLCLLNSVCYANYRQLLNPERLKDVSTASDYTIPDHNYVTIKRKDFSVVYQAICDQPGPSIPVKYIESLLNKWCGVLHIPLHRYRLDRDSRRLIHQPNSVTQPLPIVTYDICPRTSAHCVSFLISYMKLRIPDLMGDRQFEDLVSLSSDSPLLTTPLVNPTTREYTMQKLLTFIICENARTEFQMLMTCHSMRCLKCNTKLIASPLEETKDLENL